MTPFGHEDSKFSETPVSFRHQPRAEDFGVKYGQNKIIRLNTKSTIRDRNITLKIETESPARPELRDGNATTGLRITQS